MNDHHQTRCTMKRSFIIAIVLVGLALAIWLWSVAIAPAVKRQQTHELLVKQINSLAVTHMTSMRSELISLSKTHPVLEGIEQDCLESPKSPHSTNAISSFYYNKALFPKNVYCRLSFSKNTTLKECPQFTFLAPTSNGIALSASIAETMHWSYHSIREDWSPTIRDLDLSVGFDMEVGKDHKDLEKPIQEILHRHLQAFVDEAQKIK